MDEDMEFKAPDLFKQTFRYFKNKNVKPDFSKVLDFCHPLSFPEIFSVDAHPYCQSVPHNLGLKESFKWQIYGIKGIDGFYFMNNPFTQQGQQKWIQKSIELYPLKPSRTNLDAQNLNIHNPSRDIQLLHKLRWATFGFHHDWDTKVYSEKNHSKFPVCLKDLMKYLASMVGFSTFEPEATIVNYYKLDSTLSGHTDHSEIDYSAPIVSASFGQTAVFLLGSQTKSETPCAMFIRSGDIVIMSGVCRLSYHGVPLIVPEDIYQARCGFSKDCHKYIVEYLKTSRININVRQVYPNKNN